MRIRLALILLAFAVSLGSMLPVAVGAGTPAAGDLTSLLEDLRRGGYVIFFRHAATNWNEEDKEEAMKATGEFSLGDCTTQRNLSVEGRRQAERLGAALRTLAIPIGRIAASRYCRTQDTARLAFGWAAPSELLTPGQQASVSRAEALKRLVGTSLVSAQNTVLVGHSDMMRTGFGIDVSEMEGVVIRPDPGGKPQMVARLRLEQWEALAATTGAADGTTPAAPSP
jgi:phosphohistidine phosphatase SixA